MRDNPVGVRANAQVCMYMRALYACRHVSLRANEKKKLWIQNARPRPEARGVVSDKHVYMLTHACNGGEKKDMNAKMQIRFVCTKLFIELS